MSDPGMKPGGMFDRFSGWAGQRPKPEPVKIPENAAGGNNGNSDPNTKNNTITDADLDAIWTSVKKTDTNTNQTNSQQNNQQQPPPVDPAKQVSDYMKSVGLDPITLSESEIESFKNGEGIQNTLDSINSRIQKSHIESIKAMKVMMDNSIKTAVDEAVKKSRGFVEGKELQSLLHEKLPFTKSPSIDPVAQSLMQRFLDKEGATTELALEGVKKWFENTVRAVDPSYSPNPNNSGSFRRTPQAPDGGDTDWLTALKGT